MKGKVVISLAYLLFFGTAVFAQDYHKVEIPLNYSYMRFHPENSGTVSPFSLNGGGGGVAVYINHWIGIAAEFEGYASTTQTFHFRGGVPLCPLGCTVTASADLFTYNVGPVFKLHRGEHFEPFVETLFGGAHSNVYGNIKKVCTVGCQTVATPSNNAFDFIVGGGIDIPILWGGEIAIRPVQVDYVLTRFDSGFTNSNQNQSNFRFQAGVVIRF